MRIFLFLFSEDFFCVYFLDGEKECFIQVQLWRKLSATRILYKNLLFVVVFYKVTKYSW